MSKLRALGFSLLHSLELGTLEVAWPNNDSQMINLRSEFNANVLSWCASSSGQQVLKHIWEKVEYAAKRGVTTAVLTVEKLESNEFRWGVNVPFRVLVQGKPSGLLLLSRRTLSAVLKVFGYEVSWRPETVGPHKLTISW